MAAHISGGEVAREVVQRPMTIWTTIQPVGSVSMVEWKCELGRHSIKTSRNNVDSMRGRVVQNNLVRGTENGLPERIRFNWLA